MYWHQPYLFNPDNFAGNRQDVFPNVASLNMLCTPPGMELSGLRAVDLAAPEPPA